MWTFIIVEWQVLADRSLIDLRLLFQVVQAFFLNRTIESFEVSIVIGSSDPTESMAYFRILREVSRELCSMVGL